MTVAVLLPTALTDAVDRIAQRAATADAQARFLDETLTDLASGGLLSALVPVDEGGLGFDTAQFCAAAMYLGAACLSTAYVWVMHCQQVDLIFRVGSSGVRAEARRVIDEGRLICSATTEQPSVDSLFPGIDSAISPLSPGGPPGSWVLRRSAPVVSAARHAGAFLATAARADSRGVEMVWAPQAAVVDGSAGYRACPPLIGMRATENCALELELDGDEDRLIGGTGGFSGATKARWGQLAHLGWAASWVGASAQVVEWATGASARRRVERRLAVGGVPLVALARTVWDLESAIGALLRFQRTMARGGDDIEATVYSNLLKVGVSETCFRVVDEIVTQTGASALTCESAIERHWRDLRLAALVTRNDALLVGTGKLLTIRTHTARSIVDDLTRDRDIQVSEF